jgi:hypothetical protein
MKTVEGMSEHSTGIIEEYNSYRDISEEAMEEAYARETYGESFNIVRPNGKVNAYIEGKQWMDLTITEYWLPDIKEGTLLVGELLEDFPKEFIEKVI